MCKVIEDMRNESFKKGFQLGRQEGLQEGRQIGLQEARQEGLQEGLIEAAKRFLTAAVLTPDEIAKSLHLPLEEIKKLQVG